MNISRRNKVNAEGNVSSVQDLVFLLLIFFIILSTLATEGLPFDPPKASQGTANTKPDITVTITFSDMGDTLYQVNGAAELKKNQVDAQIQSRIDSVMSVHPTGEDGEDYVPSMLLRVDKAIPTGETVFVIDLAKKYECKFVMATKKGE